MSEEEMQNGYVTNPEYGMTMRDYFAVKAMQGECAACSQGAAKPEATAKWAYEMADAMLKARGESKLMLWEESSND